MKRLQPFNVQCSTFNVQGNPLCSAFTVLCAKLKETGRFSKRGTLNVEHRTVFSSPEGFTLLELVVSISLMGIIVLIVAGALSLGSRSIESAEKRIEAIERTRTSMAVVGSQIESYIPLSYEDNGERFFYFKGETNSISFSTNYSIWGGQKGYVVVTYTVEAGDNGKFSLRAAENTVGVEGTRETTLFNDLDNAYFEYFFKDPTEETGSWTNRWEDETQVPQKVKLHFVRADNDLSLIVPLRVKATAEDLAEGQSLGEE